MKSLLPIDETWTVRTMGRVIGNTASILKNNNLPDTGENAKPFATLQEQQTNVIKNATKNIIAAPGDITKLAADQLTAIKSSLADDIKAIAIAGMTAPQYAAFKVTGYAAGYLNVPQNEVTEIMPVDKNIQTMILKTHTVEQAQDVFRSQLRKVEIPAKFAPNNQSLDNWYWKPRGEVMIQIEGAEPMEIPAWPDKITDNVAVSWSQEMTTYQHYEDQNTFKQSGPRTMDLTFKLHRAMWNGNQDSGDCEVLVAYIESACYPDYDTQAAEPPRVLFTAGKSIRIYGIITGMRTEYGGPIGPDTKYDEVIINISIKEESQNVLSTQAVRSGLAGWR